MEQLENQEMPASPKQKEPKYLCKGLDIGTGTIIASHLDENNNEVKSLRVRDAFVSLAVEQKQMLKLSNISYIEEGDRVIIVGDDAANIANIFNQPLRRPLSKGTISPQEIEAQKVIKHLFRHVLGEAPVAGTPCYYSVPAAPIDADMDVTYHEMIMGQMVESLGWQACPANEAQAIVYSECADTMFSGFAMSFGAGMVNASLSYKSIPLITMAVARSGDYVDESAAKATGLSPAKICAVKEKGVDLLNPKGREQEAIAIYYKTLIRYALTNFVEKIKSQNVMAQIDLPESVPVVIGGGTSLPINFMEVVRQEVQKLKGFPFSVTDIRHAKNPLFAVSRGLLIMAQNHE
jgi:hypothetical protein